MLNYLIKNTFIIDGTGQQGYLGSVGIEGDKLAFVSHDPNPDVEAETILDGTGLVTCPGFIDIHSHARRGGYGRFDLRRSVGVP